MVAVDDETLRYVIDLMEVPSLGTKTTRPTRSLAFGENSPISSDKICFKSEFWEKVSQNCQVEGKAH